MAQLINAPEHCLENPGSNPGRISVCFFLQACYSIVGPFRSLKKHMSIASTSGTKLKLSFNTISFYISSAPMPELDPVVKW